VELGLLAKAVAARNNFIIIGWLLLSRFVMVESSHPFHIHLV
jgi:hypothetical protein